MAEAKPLTSYEVLLKLTEGHLAEVYGPLGSGKSRLLHHICLEAQNLGKQALFIDTEMGLKEEHIKQLKNYVYVGDELDALEEAVAWAKDNRSQFDLLCVDSTCHPVYVSYVELGTMDQKLKVFQRLATIFRDMVRFARGERGVDYDPKDPLKSKRKALTLCSNHPVSEFTRVAKQLPPEEPLAPAGGQIHRVPKCILRVEPFEITEEKSTFNILTYKLRDWPKNVPIGQYTIDNNGVWVDWAPQISQLIQGPAPAPAAPKVAPPTPAQAPAAKLSVEDVKNAIPEGLRGYLRFEESADYVVVTPRQFLGSENFAEIMEAVKSLNGEYVSAGRNSHFRVPRV